MAYTYSGDLNEGDCFYASTSNVVSRWGDVKSSVEGVNTLDLPDPACEGREA
jgi:hypothetical protein